MFLVFAGLMALALLIAQAFRLHRHQASLDRLEANHTSGVPRDLGGALVPR